MDRPRLLDYSTDNCSVGRTLSVVGEKWALQVLREVFNGVRRFEDMQAHTGAPRQVLADRLARLVEQGVLRRQPYRQPGHRTREEYRLTDKGRELYPVLMALLAWGDRWMADPEGPSVLVEHRDCGAPVQVRLSCAAGHPVGSAREAIARPGPGARARVPAGSG
jgi:DNA-binding HxlR family transcriptional regulator